MSGKQGGARRQGQSKEQRQAEVEALQARLVEQVETLRSSAGWAAFLRGVRRFHRYSVGNAILIGLQAPDASYVAGYRTWQSLGRQVRKGERGIRILGGRDFVSTEKDEKTGEETQRRRVVFAPVSVFDYAQTDPIEGAASVFVDQGPTPLEGADEGHVFDRVAAHLHATGWTVLREPILSGALGYTTPAEGGRVVVDSRLSDAQAAKTIVHEAAHVTLGHLERLEEYAVHRGVMEVEAESVAFVVASLLGLDTTSYSTGYVAGWAETAAPDVLKETAARVQKAVHALADALEVVDASALEVIAAGA